MINNEATFKSNSHRFKNNIQISNPQYNNSHSQRINNKGTRNNPTNPEKRENGLFNSIKAKKAAK